MSGIIIFIVMLEILLYDSANLDRICKDSGGNRSGENCLIPIKDSTPVDVDELDWSKITMMKPNTMKRFYYPNPEDTDNRDVFQLFTLVRLPEHLGGGVDGVSAFRAYNAVSLTTDHCVIKYWQDHKRQRLEDPCWGSMYRIVDGLMITSPDLIMNTVPAALPYLELSVDENGSLYVEPPTWTREENGVVGTGRIMPAQYIHQGSQIMVDGYEKSHPRHPKVPVTFGGYHLTELHADNDVEARYSDLTSSTGYADLRIDNVSAAQQQFFLNLATDSELWQVNDTLMKIGGSALNPHTTQPERFQEYRIEFILDGYMFDVKGKNIELLKKSIIANFFPENDYDDLFLISSTVRE